jgi:hypothetical protein
MPPRRRQPQQQQENEDLLFDIDELKTGALKKLINEFKLNIYIPKNISLQVKKNIFKLINDIFISCIVNNDQKCFNDDTFIMIFLIYIISV